MKCSFCGKKQEEVFKLIAASDKAAICDECVFSCMETLVYPEEVTVLELDDDESLHPTDELNQKNIGC